MAGEDKLTQEERLDAVAEILARGVRRWLVQNRGHPQAIASEETRTADSEVESRQ